VDLGRQFVAGIDGATTGEQPGNVEKPPAPTHTSVWLLTAGTRTGVPS
jgi:hypothetical protein